jgi:hypothetical protein
VGDAVGLDDADLLQVDEVDVLEQRDTGPEQARHDVQIDLVEKPETE